MITKEELLAYFLSLATTAPEEEYIHRMFQKQEFSSEDRDFLQAVQERRVQALDAYDQELDEAMQVLEFSMAQSLETMAAIEENYPFIKDELFKEAFEERNTTVAEKNASEIEKLRELLKK